MSVPPPTPPEDARAGYAGEHTERAEEDNSVGELVSVVIEDTERLLRQEVALAKAELREEASKAGKAAGMMSGAALAGYLVIVLVTLAAVFGLGTAIGLGWSALVVAAVWAVIGAALFFAGRTQMRTLSPPTQTIESLKEDARWARHPTR